MIKNLDEVKEFLKVHENPHVVISPTIKHGYVSCIGPVPTICGPELHVSAYTKPEINNLILGIRAE